MLSLCTGNLALTKQQTTDNLSCLDRVLRSAARPIGRIPKYDHISTYMRCILHWLPARQRVEYRTAAFKCIGMALFAGPC